MQSTRRSSSANSSPGDKMSSEIEALKDGLGELRNDVTELLNHALGVGRSGAEAAKDSAAGAIDRLKDRFEELREQGADQVSTVERRIKKYPFRSVLIAFGVGYIWGRIFSR